MKAPAALETVSIEVGPDHLELWEQTLAEVCDTVGFFLDEATGRWRIEGVRPVTQDDGKFLGLLALAEAASGEAVAVQRQPTPADGWLQRTQQAFPEQEVDRFVIRGTHLPRQERAGRITLVLDAGAAFGSGEHASTRGCLRALTLVAHRRPRRILDVGTGSGILAMAAARLLHRPVLATDIDPWSVRVAAENARRNRVGALVRTGTANGWQGRLVRAAGPYDLVFANILARPLCLMAASLAAGLSPGGTAILSGLLSRQARLVISAHRRVGLRLERIIVEGAWSTLIVRSGAQRK